MCATLGPLHTQAKGRDHVIMRSLDSHPEASYTNCLTDTIYRNLHWANLSQEQILTNHVTLFIICDVKTHVDFSRLFGRLGLPPSSVN
jgi:hypothetical protein